MRTSAISANQNASASCKAAGSHPSAALECKSRLLHSGLAVASGFGSSPTQSWCVQKVSAKAVRPVCLLARVIPHTMFCTALHSRPYVPYGMLPPVSQGSLIKEVVCPRASELLHAWPVDLPPSKFCTHATSVRACCTYIFG